MAAGEMCLRSGMMVAVAVGGYWWSNAGSEVEGCGEDIRFVIVGLGVWC